MVVDVAYILNLEGSVVIEDGNHNTRVMGNSDETTFGRVQVNQTIYLNKMAQEWCDFSALTSMHSLTNGALTTSVSQ